MAWGEACALGSIHIKLCHESASILPEEGGSLTIPNFIVPTVYYDAGIQRCPQMQGDLFTVHEMTNTHHEL
jgi:hypothetical protein